MSDPKEDLAALRIEREPMRPGRWAPGKWIVLLLLLGPRAPAAGCG